MATNTGSSDSNTSTDETSDEDNTNTADTSAEETSDQDTSGDNTAEQDETSSDSTDSDKGTKPKADPAKQALQRDLSTARKEAKTHKARVAELEQQVADLTPKAETGEAWESKYTRLEEFVQGLPGSLGKVLDSRSFTQRLFETDDDIDDIVKDWNKANPSATSTALGSSSSEPAGGKVDANKLIRAAYNGGK